MSMHPRQRTSQNRRLNQRRDRAAAGTAVALLACLLAQPGGSQQSQPLPAQTRPLAAPEDAAPADEELRAVLADAQEAYLRGAWSEALAGLERAALAFPGDALVQYQYGFCLERAGEHEAALEHKRRARDLFGAQAEGSKHWEPFYYLAALEALDFDDRAKARDFAVRGLGRIGEGVELDGVDCFRVSRLAGFAERPQDAERWMERAADRFAAEETPPPAYATEALWSSGERAFQAADYERARERLERAAELAESANSAWYLAAVARLRLGDRAGAVQSLRKLAHDPGRTEGQYAIRVVQRSESLKLPEALPDGRAIDGLRPEDQTSALRRACAGEYEEESEVLALALLMEYLLRGQILREMALRSGCVDIIFR